MYDPELALENQREMETIRETIQGLISSFEEKVGADSPWVRIFEQINDSFEMLFEMLEVYQNSFNEDEKAQIKRDAHKIMSAIYRAVDKMVEVATGKQIMYTAVVLDSESVAKLKEAFPLPAGWAGKYHHMTVNMGPPSKGPAAHLVGQEVEIRVVSLASNALVMAVGVECSVPSVNAQKHITLAVNEANGGGKPKMSNDLTDWQPVAGLVLKGTVVEV